MATLRFLGLPAGDAFNLTVASGGQTVGPTSFTKSASGGDISITTLRDSVSYAPESVGFRVDLSASTFDTPGPTGDEVYDARLHDLFYLWSFGDPGVWTAPVNVLDAWKDGNVGKGPFVKHVFREPGTYTVSVYVIEPSSGKVAYAEASVTVADPDTVFPGTQTICVSSSGDFTGAPSGAVQLTLSEVYAGTTSEWASYGDPTKNMRWLFRAGETFTTYVRLDTAIALTSFCLGSFGSGARPILNTSEVLGRNSSVLVRGIPEATVHDVVLAGTYDPTTTWQKDGLTPFGISSTSETFTTVDNVSMSGYHDACVALAGTVMTDEIGIHLNDCTMTDFGGEYCIILTGSSEAASNYAITGTRVAQNPLGLHDGGDIRSTMRAEHMNLLYLAGNDFFWNIDWQNGWKLMETPSADNGLVNAHSCSIEGPGNPIRICGNTAGALARSTAHNIILDGLALIGNHSTVTFMQTNSSGVTMRNCLCVLPSSPYRPTESSTAFNRPVTLGLVGNSEPDYVLDAAINVYNNTFRIDRTAADNGGSSGQGISTNPYNNGFIGNNLDWRDTTDESQGPLTSTSLWTARYAGYRNAASAAPQFTLSSDVDDTETVTIPYWTIYNGDTLTASEFALETGNSTLSIDEATAVGEGDSVYSVVYGASGAEITNISGGTWTSGTTLDFVCDMGGSAPLDTDYATPAGSVKDSKPDTGSAALGGATTGDVAYDDISAPGAVVRGGAASVDDGAWQVTA